MEETISEILEDPIAAAEKNENLDSARHQSESGNSEADVILKDSQYKTLEAVHIR